MSRFACKCCGVDEVKDSAKAAVLSLEEALGVELIITSAYRCPKHNKAVGGVRSSRHTVNKDAFDILWPNDESRKAFIEAAVKLGFKGIGLGKTFVHLDMRLNQTIWIYK